MFKNDKYVYGPSSSVTPIHIHLGEFLMERIIQAGDATALINAETDEHLSYPQILKDGISFAVSLYNLGVRKGHTVAICSENRLEYPATILGILAVGATITTINVAYTKGELKHVLAIAKPEYIICSPATYKMKGTFFQPQPHVKKIIVYGNENLGNTVSFNELLKSNENVPIDKFKVIDVEGQNDVAVILYSSGTTGLPKGVMLTHLNVIASCTRGSANSSETDAMKTTALSMAPWFHTMGLIGLIWGLRLNRITVFIPKFEIQLYLRSVEKYKVDLLTLVPPVLVALTKYQGESDLSSVTMIYSGAAPLHKDVIEDVKKKFPNLIAVAQGYGMTETTLGVTSDNNLNLEKTNKGTVGQVTDYCTIKVVNPETRQPLGPNEAGEICVKSVLVMKGYIGKDKHDDFDDEGFFKTGDIGYYDEDGYFFIVDRLKELIKYKAYQVPPAEIEAILLTHPSIRDAGVVGIPRRDAGEVPLAFVVLQPGAQVTEEEIKAYVAERLSNPKHLRGGVTFVQEIPKNPSGKILRKDLREMAKKKRSKL